MLEPQATLTPCHPEHTFSLAQRKSKQKESKTGWLSKQLCHPELASGSSPRSIIPSSENIKNITSTSHTAQRHVRGDYVPQKESETEWLPKQLCHPRHVSGSCHRGLGTITKSKCLISKSDPRTNVWLKAQSTYLINIKSKERMRILVRF